MKTEDTRKVCSLSWNKMDNVQCFRYILRIWYKQHNMYTLWYDHVLCGLSRRYTEGTSEVILTKFSTEYVHKSGRTWHKIYEELMSCEEIFIQLINDFKKSTEGNKTGGFAPLPLIILNA